MNKKSLVSVICIVCMGLSLTGCAAIFNLNENSEKTFVKSVDGFEVYQLNTNYDMLVWNQNRAKGKCTCSASSNQHKTTNSRYIGSATVYAWKVNYYHSESTDVPSYSTEAKAAEPLGLKLTFGYDSTTDKTTFTWSSLPVQLVSHIDGLYIVASEMLSTRNLPSDNKELKNTDATTYIREGDCSSGRYCLFIKVDKDYYNIGRFIKQ